MSGQILDIIIRKYGHVAVVLILTTTVASFFSLLGIDAHHHGVMFKSALDVANGQMLFRDTFTPYGAMTILLQALVLKVFGNH